MRFTILARRLLAAAFFLSSLCCTHAIAQDPVVGRVSGAEVTRTEFRGALLQALRTEAQPLTDVDQQKSLIDALLDFKTVPARAEKIYQLTRTENAFIARQVGEAQLRAIAMIADFRYREKINKDSPRVQQRARELYLASPDQFNSSESYDISHIVVRTDNRSLEDAVGRANDAYKKLSAGESFATVSALLSDDPSAKANKGRLPPLAPEQVDNDFAKRVMNKANVGQLLKPFIARSGIHVALLHAYNAPRRLTFDEAKEAAVERAVDELVAAERNKDWAAMRIDPSARSYDLASIADLIKPAQKNTMSPEVLNEVRRIKAEQATKK